MNASIDISRALRKLKDLDEKVRAKAAVRALNKTGAMAKTQASKEIRAAGYNIKAAAIKKEVQVYLASPGRLVVRVKATGKPIGLINYSARQTKQGVTVNVLKGRKLIRHAFIATMANGHKGVFERLGNQHKWKVLNGKRQRTAGPILELYGPAIPSAFASKAVMDALIASVKANFPRLLQHEIEYLGLKR